MYGLLTSTQIVMCRIILQAVEDVLLPHLPTYWQHLQAVMEGKSVANAQKKAEGCHVTGAIQVRLLYFSN